MSTDEKNEMHGRGLSQLAHFNHYRCYLTPEYWLITYKDADFIRLMRRTEHKAGFALILLELIWDLCRGKRTALRERWAVHSELAQSDAKKLLLQQRAADRQVIEFWFERGPQTTRASAGEEPQQ